MQLINSIVPTFILIILGWILAKKKLVNSDMSMQLAHYVFWVASPAIIFSSISQYDISQILAWRFTLAHTLMIIVVTGASYYLMKVHFQERPMHAVMAGMNASVKNTFMIGLPLLWGIAGSKAAIPIAITLIVFNLILTPLILLLFEVRNVKQQGHGYENIAISVVKGLIKNPLVIAAVIGMLFTIWHLHLPTMLNTVVTSLADSFIPCALIAVGIDLCGFKLYENSKTLIAITLFNLVLCPLVAVVIAYALHLSAFYATSLVVLSSLPTAKSMYIYARKYQFYEKETAAVISLTTIGSALSIPCFVALCYLLWPAAFQAT